MVSMWAQSFAGKKESSVKLELITLGDPIVMKSETGEIQNIDLKEFFQCFVKYEQEFIDLTGNHASDKHEAFQASIVKSKIYIALDMLSKHVGNMDLVMQVKPTKTLTAASDFKSESCILVPCTSTVLAVRDGNDRPKTAVPINFGSDALQGISFFLSPMSLSPDKDNKANMNVPYWAVKSTAKPDEANMYSSTMPVSISLKVDKKSGSDTIHVPVLKNRLPLKAGEELKIFVNTSDGDGDGDDDEEPDDNPQPKGKGKGKGKGKKGGRPAGKSPSGQSMQQKGQKRKAS